MNGSDATRFAAFPRVASPDAREALGAAQIGFPTTQHLGLGVAPNFAVSDRRFRWKASKSPKYVRLRIGAADGKSAGEAENRLAVHVVTACGVPPADRQKKAKKAAAKQAKRASWHGVEESEKGYVVDLRVEIGMGTTGIAQIPEFEDKELEMGFTRIAIGSWIVLMIAVNDSFAEGDSSSVQPLADVGFSAPSAYVAEHAKTSVRAYHSHSTEVITIRYATGSLGNNFALPPFPYKLVRK